MVHPSSWALGDGHQAATHVRQAALGRTTTLSAVLLYKDDKKLPSKLLPEQSMHSRLVDSDAGMGKQKLNS